MAMMFAWAEILAEKFLSANRNLVVLRESSPRGFLQIG